MRRPNLSPAQPEAGRDSPTYEPPARNDAGGQGQVVKPPTRHPSTDVHAHLILGDLIIPLSNDRETVIGRDNTTCDVVLADPRVSKMHASIYYAGDRFFLKDLGSLNGCAVNSQPLTSVHPLVSGDDIVMPPYSMVFAGPHHPRIQRMKRTEPKQPKASSGVGHFAGQLNILSITDLIQLLNATRQSGLLSIVDATGETALISFHRGEILQAQYRNLQGEDAVYEVLTSSEGHFEFVQGKPPVPAEPLKIPTLTLLLDGCRIMDENEAAAAHKPSVPAVPIDLAGELDTFILIPSGEAQRAAGE